MWFCRCSLCTRRNRHPSTKHASTHNRRHGGGGRGREKASCPAVHCASGRRLSRRSAPTYAACDACARPRSGAQASQTSDVGATSSDATAAQPVGTVVLQAGSMSLLVYTQRTATRVGAAAGLFAWLKCVGPVCLAEVCVRVPRATVCHSVPQCHTVCVRVPQCVRVRANIMIVESS